MHIDYEDLGQIEKEDARAPHGAGLVYGAITGLLCFTVIGVILALFA